MKTFFAQNIYPNLDITTIIIIETEQVIMGGKIRITATPAAINITVVTATGTTNRSIATLMTGERK